MATATLFIPHSLAEALDRLREHGADLLVMGGGTILMEQINEGNLFPRQAMSLRRAGMDGVRKVDGTIEIGATTTLAQLGQLDSVPILAQAATTVGGPALRTMATIGGNLFALPPYGDLAVPLLALGAQVELASPDKHRTVPLEEFLANRAHVRAANELVTAVHIPQPQGYSVYIKYGRRRANTPSVVAVAVQVMVGTDGICSNIRIALGSAGPFALRARQAEATLVGQPLDTKNINAAAEAAMAECNPLTDSLASAWYRRRMVGVYVRRALEQASRRG
jgi:xanthine dehydrogenase small subunit